jgi:hypothetical protein
MPNWCDNTLEITGPDESVKKLIAFVSRPFSHTWEDGTVENFEKPIFAFENILPSTHDTSSAMFPSAGPNDWWSNNVNSWGTKWDIANSDSVGLSIGEGAVSYWFSTAWAPPSPVILRLAEIFPELEIIHSYSEPGCDFWGIETYAKGELISEVGGELDHKAWTTLGQECWNCSENEDIEDMYSDCPPVLEAKKKKGKKVKA